MKEKILKIIAAMLIISALTGYGGYRYSLIVKELKETQKKLKETQENLATTITNFENKIKGLENNIESLKNENSNVKSALAAEQTKNNLFDNQIKSIGNMVNTLEKLSKIDKELLQKYSKVYFLNENYKPSNLTDIDLKYLYKKDKPVQIHGNVWPYLKKMLEAADSNDTSLEIISAYRSFGTQASLKLNYKMTYGSGANQFSADQGYSEHQLGTTVDFTTPNLGASFLKLETTTAYKWLTENAHKYGFILSYPKQNSYYQFEPWHWRFIGVDLATKLYNNNQYFYNLDQREINGYLISIFD